MNGSDSFVLAIVSVYAVLSVAIKQQSAFYNNILILVQAALPFRL